MKYLKIVPFALVATFVSQDALAIGEKAGQVATQQVQVARQQIQNAQLVVDQNAYLGGLVTPLPQTPEYRAALVAAGGHGGGATAEVIMLHKIGAGVNPADGPQQAAVLAMFPLVGGNLNIITAEAVIAAVELRALIVLGGLVPAFTEQNIRAVSNLLDPDIAPAIVVTTNYINAVLALNLLNIEIGQDNVDAADEIIRNAGGAVNVTVLKVPAAVALLAGGIGVDVASVNAADEIIRNAGGVVNVTGPKVIAAAALINGLGGPLAVTGPRVDAAVLLAPYIGGGGGRQVADAQVLAVIGATAVNANTGAAVVWAIENGFGGQAVGTVPVGVAEVTAIAGNDHTLAVRYGNAAIPFGANAGKFAGNDCHVHLNQLPAGTAIGHFLVFSAAANDGGVAFITLTDRAKAN